MKIYLLSWISHIAGVILTGRLTSGVWPRACAGDFPQVINMMSVGRRRIKKERENAGQPDKPVYMTEGMFLLKGEELKRKTRVWMKECARHVSLNICLVNHMSFFHSFRLALSISCSCPKAPFLFSLARFSWNLWAHNTSEHIILLHDSQEYVILVNHNYESNIFIECC